MYHRVSNESFALVRDESIGLDFWEVWDERMPFGSHGYKIMVVVHDFWFAAADDGDWNVPFRSRQQACAFRRTILHRHIDVHDVRRRGDSHDFTVVTVTSNDFRVRQRLQLTRKSELSRRDALLSHVPLPCALVGP